MYHASEAVAKAQSTSDPSADPLQILKNAYSQVLDESRIIAGSSTATILTMDGETGHLRSANLGDSGFIVLREGAGEESQPQGEAAPAEGQDAAKGNGAEGKRPLPGALYRSVPQQYEFNAPYQLSKYPKQLIELWTKENDGKAPDLQSDPAKADRWECKLKHGDIVIVASDGAWDNVWGKEWVNLVVSSIRGIRNVWYAAELTSLTPSSAVPDSNSSARNTPRPLRLTKKSKLSFLSRRRTRTSTSRGSKRRLSSRSLHSSESPGSANAGRLSIASQLTASLCFHLFSFPQRPAVHFDVSVLGEEAVALRGRIREEQTALAGRQGRRRRHRRRSRRRGMRG